MNLNSSLQSLLDTPTKAFEVALRCYTADTLLRQYPSESALKTEIQNRVSLLKTSNVILSGKISSINILSAKTWPDFWSNTCFSQSCFQQRAHINSHDVVYLSQTLLITYLFQELYTDLIQAFSGPEKYIYYSSKYYDIRNALSHQGSSLVEEADALDSVHFMRIGHQTIAPDYFWFRSTIQLEKDLSSFEDALYSKSPMIDNISSIPGSSNAIVCREPELEKLFKYVCSWDGVRKLRNSKHFVCISGYGGIGKTALVTEFVSQLLDKMPSDAYYGLRPKFILFYSAKMQSMEFDPNSGVLYIKKTRRQFSTCDELLSHFYKDLSIDSFTDDWQDPGILIVDNLETLAAEERNKIVDFINDDLPSSIHVIITTRIPEHADEMLTLRGFQDEAGITFIDEFLQKNELSLELDQEQKKELIKHSYGNSLVLVLALKRMASKKASYRKIMQELKQLPKDIGGNSISQFMFQNTIEELYRIYPALCQTIQDILVCLSVYTEPLSSEILFLTLKNHSREDIETALQLLAQYLVVEKTDDAYEINEFASSFIDTSNVLSLSAKTKMESQLLTSIHLADSQKKNVQDFKQRYPELSDVINEWRGSCENENLAICRAFDLYNRIYNITTSNAPYEIENLDFEFDRIEASCNPHPYVYYQHARILKELRRDNVIQDEYDKEILSNFNSCFMLIDNPAFSEIKNTKTYPSILWIYAIFLLSINSLESSSFHADLSVKNYERLQIQNDDYEDAILIYGIAEAKLFFQNYDKNHLRNARSAEQRFQKRAQLPKNVQQHADQLTQLLQSASRFKL